MEQLSLLGDAPVPVGATARNSARASARTSARASPIRPAPVAEDLAALAAALAARSGGRLRLGTSSWSFPGWAGLVYAEPAAPAALSRGGLDAYARHPLLRTVGIDSGFYAPLDAARLARYAAQVPADFRFLVKAPALITDRVRRAEGGRPAGPNPGFLDPALAVEVAVEPYLTGLGGLNGRGGVLLWQFPPLLGATGATGDGGTDAARRFAEDLYRFLRRLPRGPVYAVEVRDRALLSADLVGALHHGGALPALAVHPRLPALAVQADLFDAALSTPASAPLVLRWLLRANRGYGEARERYAPFDRLAEPDAPTRAAVVRLIDAALAAGREVLVIANNKAEGSAPLTLIELARALVASAEARTGAAAPTGDSDRIARGADAAPVRG